MKALSFMNWLVVHLASLSPVANFDPDTFSVMHCEFCKAGFDTRAGLSSHARAHLRDFGITNWDITISPIHILRELFSSRPDLVIPTAPPRSQSSYSEEEEEEEEGEEDDEERNYKDGIIKVKLEGGTSKRTPCVSDLNAVASASCHQWKKKDGEEDCRGMFNFCNYLKIERSCWFWVWIVVTGESLSYCPATLEMPNI